MATVTNWIDHLSAKEVQGAIYPGVGSEGILVILASSFGQVGMLFLQSKKVKNTKSLQEKDMGQTIGKITLPMAN